MKVLSLVFIFLCCQFTLGQYVRLIFRQTVSRYKSNNYYYALKGQNVSLACVKRGRPASSSTLNLYKGIHWETTVVIARNGIPLQNESGRYTELSVGKKKDICVMFIYNVSELDSSPYACTSFQRMDNMSARVSFDYSDLRVLNKRAGPNFCDFVSGTDGIFFTGDDLKLRCPNDADLKIKFKLRDGESSIELKNLTCEPINSLFCVIFIRNITRNLNDASVFCTKHTEGFTEDLCHHIPAIKVYDDLDPSLQLLEWNQAENYVTVACNNRPALLSSIDWKVFGNDVSFEGTEDLHHLRINLNNFSQSTVNSFEVTCEIKFGSRSSTKSAVFDQTSLMTFKRSSDVITTPSHELAIERNYNTRWSLIAVLIGCTLTVLIVLGMIFFIFMKRYLKQKRGLERAPRASFPPMPSEVGEKDTRQRHASTSAGWTRSESSDENLYTYADVECKRVTVNYKETTRNIYQNAT